MCYSRRWVTKILVDSPPTQVNCTVLSWAYGLLPFASAVTPSLIKFLHATRELCFPIATVDIIMSFTSPQNKVVSAAQVRRISGKVTAEMLTAPFARVQLAKTA